MSEQAIITIKYWEKSSDRIMLTVDGPTRAAGDVAIMIGSNACRVRVYDNDSVGDVAERMSKELRSYCKIRRVRWELKPPTPKEVDWLEEPVNTWAQRRCLLSASTPTVRKGAGEAGNRITSLSIGGQPFNVVGGADFRPMHFPVHIPGGEQPAPGPYQALFLSEEYKNGV
jgi:hypothetical protein